MLTRDLVLTRKRNGKLRPQFIDPKERALLQLAETLSSLITVNEPLELIEERLAAQQFDRPRVAAGLSKLLLDRATVEEPLGEHWEGRLTRFREAAQVLRTHFDTFETTLTERWGDLEQIRQQLYADLPGRRRVLSFETITAPKLLSRYNLALAQGPLLTARQVSVRILGCDTLRVRRVLRWLKFCRLVAEVRHVGEDWLLEVEGPAALFTQQKRYGLQLATFLTVLPALQRWELTAQVQRGGTYFLNHEDPLDSPHPSALGHIPQELVALARLLEAEGFQVDPAPLPRHTGARGMCVPDFSVREPGGTRELAIELFHPWHASALTRRLADLTTRPDAGLILGVDRSVAKVEALNGALHERPDIFLFNGFPSIRSLKTKLSERLRPNSPP
ncbi:MAG: DUF790 family protein [Myxococcaceae bacterium]